MSRHVAGPQRGRAEGASDPRGGAMDGTEQNWEIGRSQRREAT